MSRRPQTVSRRDVVRAIPLLALLSAVAGLGAATGCELDHPDYLTARRKKARGAGVVPTDDDEYVPADTTLAPANAGDAPSAVPNQSWEARVRQLESEQRRLYGAVFTADATTNRLMAGKERSHVPRLELTTEARRVTVAVDHVMGKSATADGGSDAARSDAAPVDAAVIDGAVADAAVADASTGPEHYVTTIYLRGIVDGQDTVVGLWELAVSDPVAAVSFAVPEGVTTVVAYEWCTLHGLWQSDPLEVPA